ncbi:MAG: response regulator transcription factor [Gammaproteobacteria bacterium]|nr:response regulator transcription factor [Gammaproteobacteria bacterium]MDH5801697.1 response regulator transcription factor [Gammaproteobacteria bacterium]
MQRILVVDDDAHIRQVLHFALEKAGYEVVEAENGRQALQQFEEKAPQLLVLDIMMPEMDGTDVCREIRKSSNVPIVFLSSRDEEIDRILGLELGGDDYITKPFSPRELVARVKAVLRRTTAIQQTSAGQRNGTQSRSTLSHGKLSLNELEFKAYWDKEEIVLTVTEFGLLKTLLSQPGRVFSREQLMNSAYDFNNVVSDRTIDSHMRRVRAKLSALGASPIETVHGVGYKLGDA